MNRCLSDLVLNIIWKETLQNSHKMFVLIWFVTFSLRPSLDKRNDLKFCLCIYVQMLSPLKYFQLQET